MGVLCARPTMLLSVTEQASGEAYTTLPSRARGQVRQPVAGSTPKGRRQGTTGVITGVVVLPSVNNRDFAATALSGCKGKHRLTNKGTTTKNAIEMATTVNLTLEKKLRRADMRI